MGDRSELPVSPALVSVVIPTIRRPELVLRAVRSVLGQTYPAVEVVVVIDGPDDFTAAALTSIKDERVRVLQNMSSLGPGPARNRAAREARGEWLAFLDDDDEWLPDKLARQLESQTADRDVVLSCRCRVETPQATYIWPDRLCGPREPIDEYLFVRRSLHRSEAYLATPTVVLPRRLFEASDGFGSTMQNEDIALLLRVTKTLGAALVMLPDVLTVIHTEEDRWSTGTVFDWREALAWADGMGDLITPRAYSGLALVTAGSQAADSGDVRAIPILLQASFRRGKPTARQLLLFAAFWAVPPRLRQRVRAALTRLRAPTHASKRALTQSTVARTNAPC
jgi:glycosyltransferase involved in cell wall biosynthesis